MLDSLEDATATVDRAGHDGAVSPAEQIHAVNLASLEGEFVKVGSTEDVLESLKAAAATAG